ncbi:peptide-methionine (S)-S-oxide reductase [Hydrogenispora ethanolica]|uniref:Peptide methionine sulfoxide reductase MsrA n=1 Tax=Hydrogenispora ethanolica TaxID=1082276 RepID=A0A4R1RVN4_HYDET|nr:peptide-methionine (S)-S-oxide reductase MsrA [Hydrogenispora ethanolica]TCL70723.1 peptide-methionine (S)-S-oxide reductase [Hydrogenispora ethanolica]
MAVAIFGAGCFWGVEAAFRGLDGVTDTAVGYMGGDLDHPTYEDVCTDRTGHAEVVRVEYDPERVSYEQLLKKFWEIHDPTTLNRQGPDIGTQYRSVIFYEDQMQQAAASAAKAELERSGRFSRPVVTAILPAGPFWRAEEYHQRYLEKRGLKGCGLPGPQGAD